MKGHKNEGKHNQQLAVILYKYIITKIQKQSIFIFYEYVWSFDFVGLQLLVDTTKDFVLLLCVVYVYTKHEFLIPLK